MSYVTVKNWKEFQHYKDRCPPWIKLHHAILDDFEFHGLPVASRALAPCIWLIASEHKEGVVDANYEKLAFRLRQTARQIEDALTPLIERGFLLVVQSDSNALADRKQGAVPETEGEERQKSANRGKSAIPDGWNPKPETLQALSAEFKADAAAYIEPFRDACRAKDYRYKDFEAAFRNCVRQDWPKLRNGRPTGPGGLAL